MKKTKQRKTKVKKRVGIKDLPPKTARDDEVRGGADPINEARIKRL